MKKLFIKSFVIVCTACMTILSMMVGAGYWWYTTNIQPISKMHTPIEIQIKEGQSFNDTAKMLEERGIIKSALAFRIWTILSGEEPTVQAGNHTLSPNMELQEIAQQLAYGIKEVKIFIKEGVRVEEIAEIMEQHLDKTFNKAEFLVLAKPKEGMLFPDTYKFKKATSADTIVTQLNNQFEKKYAQINGPTYPKEKKEIIIIASLLEREGKNDTDRAIISGIIRNRLNKPNESARLLQIDATLQYALNETRKNTATWWPIPKPKDKEIDSPFNTYKYKGLPPAPICNPGISALKAAITPQESTYLYYIHDNAGKAYYAQTLAEHNANIAKYLQ